MSYPVGTICIGQNFVEATHLNGMECVIITPAMMQHWGLPRAGCGIVYEVRWADGDVQFCWPNKLKRKDWYDEEKRAEDRQKVSKLISDCKKAAEAAIEAGEKV